MISWSCRHVTHHAEEILNTVLVQYEAFLPRKTVVHYREVLVKEKIKAFRINESVLEAFRIILIETGNRVAFLLLCSFVVVCWCIVVLSSSSLSVYKRFMLTAIPRIIQTR